VTKQSFKKISILIVLTASALIAAQGYFTFQNYRVNRQRFINDVKDALNQSIDTYFTEKTKSQVFILTQSSSDTVQGKLAQSVSKSYLNIDSLVKELKDSSSVKSVFGFSHEWSSETTSKSISINTDSLIKLRVDTASVNIIRDFSQLDSMKIKEFEFLTQKVVMSVNQELLDLGKLYTKLDDALANKDIDIDFKLKQEVRGSKTSMGSVDGTNFLTAQATSALLGSKHAISIEFENATLLILRDGINELVLSLLLISLVVGTMAYLYRTIYHQKQLAEIKDDLISNITHEFKTPIATIFSALEGVTNFNETNDPEKTKRYIDLSNNQLKKLNKMVEKMLETATIDHGKLTLDIEEVGVVGWTKDIVDRFAMITADKTISYESVLQSHVAHFDRFHIENTLSNLLDNAIKYGGDRIIVRLKLQKEKLIWEVEDNGEGIPKAQRDRIFDKLYRIPTGNQHDVKGFGIGLYYAKTIAELHEGQLTLEVERHKTLFKLAL